MELDVRALAAFYDYAAGAGCAAGDPASGAGAVARPEGSAAAGLWLCRALSAGVPRRGGAGWWRRCPRRWGSRPGRRTDAPPRFAPKTRCPFADVLFDRILIVHGLEGAESLRPLLRQVWRVLAPEGRILIVAPQPRQPVGPGRTLALRPWPPLFARRTGPPAARRAVRAGPLGARALCPRRCAAAHWCATARAGNGWDRGCSPGLGGVHVVEATKSLYAAAPVLPQRGAGALQTGGLGRLNGMLRQAQHEDGVLFGGRKSSP